MPDELREFLCRGRLERLRQIRRREPASPLSRGWQDAVLAGQHRLPQISCDFGKGSLNVQSAQIRVSFCLADRGPPGEVRARRWPARFYVNDRKQSRYFIVLKPKAMDWVKMLPCWIVATVCVASSGTRLPFHRRWPERHCGKAYSHLTSALCYGCRS